MSMSLKSGAGKLGVDVGLSVGQSKLMWGFKAIPPNIFLLAVSAGDFQNTSEYSTLSLSAMQHILWSFSQFQSLLTELRRPK